MAPRNAREADAEVQRLTGALHLQTIRLREARIALVELGPTRENLREIRRASEAVTVTAKQLTDAAVVLISFIE